MARKSTQELLAEITAKFPDNTTGLITPAVVRQMLQDIVLSYQPSHGLLQQVADSVQTVNIAPSRMTFSTGEDSIPGQTISITGALSKIALADPGTTAFEFTADFECQSGRFVTFTLYKNGLPTLWQVTGNGGGANNPIAVAFSAIDYVETAAADYSIWVSCEVNATAVTLFNASFVASIRPVNSYV